MPTVVELLSRHAALAGVAEDARRETELLLQAATGLSRAALRSRPEMLIPAEEAERFLAWLARRAAGEPVAYLLGSRDFWSMTLAVSPEVLIPRADTERLVECTLGRLGEGEATVADLGTGSGAVALALAVERPAWTVLAVERSPGAAAIAEQNRQRWAPLNCRVLRGSWCDALASCAFDAIVSNPPYIAPDDPHLTQGDLRFEPLSALAAEAAGLADLRSIIEAARRCLRSGGHLLLEHGWQQAPAVRALLAESGYREIISHRDLAGHERVTEGQWPA